jgi:hypothetical protein
VMRLCETIVVVSVLGLALSCGNKPGPKPTALFPETNDVPGWSRSGETRTFEAGDLWQYIDGDADKYIQAGVVRTLTADYRYQDSIEAVADIYVMGTQDGARRVFESEPSMDSRNVELGEAGRLYGASLTFRKGPYFVRLVAYQAVPEVGKALVDLASAIEEKLEQQGGN